jgi:formamidopyrimidine-DNA glycosylase
MPELPDVEVFKGYLDSTALHKKITEVLVRDDYVLAAIDESTLAQALERRQLEETHRHGKHLFAHLDDGRWLRLHFGMSGHLKYYKNQEKEPDYTRVLWAFDNGYHLAYASQRMLGKVGVIDDVDAFIQEKGLGPDLLRADWATFAQALEGHRGMVKPTLMNQEILAGLGNVYVDEVLFQAGIDPEISVNELSEDKLHDLWDEIQRVIDVALNHQANPDAFPHDFVIPHRHEDGKCPHCGDPLEKLKVSGRTTYRCPKKQATKA